MLRLQREVRLMLEKNRGLWEIKMSAAVPNALELYIYTDVRGDYYDWWERKFVESTTSAEYFRKELEKYPDVREINIFINSLGGSVMEGTAIYNQLRRHPAHKTVYVDGFACSIASVIAMAGCPHRCAIFTTSPGSQKPSIELSLVCRCSSMRFSAAVSLRGIRTTFKMS